MRRLLFAAFAAATLAAPAAALSASASPPLVVQMDQATRVMLRGPIRDVVIANPKIADVNVLDDRSLVVLGKAVGTTSLLVVDPAGRVLTDRQVIVSTSDEGRMSYYRGGAAVQEFACSPRCGAIASDDVGGGAQSPAP
ncbi:pilus assembly protein N-terminal domain-containing protein [Phenylobacterium sp.]|uniref:pilus assembly protein N-terminal domain-containing protein n=1 Tax=Phenylobacterium sp. TaxID=1871053 RepID=UPI0035AE6888